MAFQAVSIIQWVLRCLSATIVFLKHLFAIIYSSRELVIAFVYDTQKCTQEADDPQDAVLFFHPGWVSEQQRLALCGQLMGATYFLLASFSPPRILSLQSGKFAIRIFGRYIVVSIVHSLVLIWRTHPISINVLTPLCFKHIKYLLLGNWDRSQHSRMGAWAESRYHDLPSWTVFWRSWNSGNTMWD